MSRDIFSCNNSEEGVISTLWVKARHVAKHPTMHKTAFPINTHTHTHTHTHVNPKMSIFPR